MTILAGVIAILHFLTVLTLINVTTQNLSPALFNRLHGQPVGKRDTLGIFLPIISPVPAEDLRQFCHSSAAVS